MKIKGGYLPRISGKPSSSVETIPAPAELRVDLLQRGVEYVARVVDGQTVALGAPLADCTISGGALCLPAPVDGTVTLQRPADGNGPATVVIRTPADKSGSKSRGVLESYDPQRADAKILRYALARGGVWPLIWSSTNAGIPALDEVPRAIIVTSVLAEPFRAAGDVVLNHWKDRIERGIRFLSRLLDDKGKVEVVVGDKTAIWRDGLVGIDRLRFHSVPFRYPVENPLVLCRALRREDASIGHDDPLWVLDVQGVAALGACLGEGMPLGERLVAIGGPGAGKPAHLCVRVGTPLSALNVTPAGKEAVRVLRGGLFKGAPVDPATAAVQYADDAFFCLPDGTDREFLSFINPGLDRTSVLSCFLSTLTGGADRKVSTFLRGERRPCIACGSCEDHCPSGLMPQMMHRFLYRGGLEEAEAIGLNLCVECGLCTYICTSKIELHSQFAETKEQIRKEHEELRQMEASPAGA